MPKITKDRRGVVVLYLVYFMVAVIIVVLAAVLAPMGVQFNTQMYAAGEDILLNANSSISQIQDDTVRGQVGDTIGAALESSENNIDVNASVFQYSWIFIVVLTFIIVFILARQTVEYGGRLI